MRMYTFCLNVSMFPRPVCWNRECGFGNTDRHRPSISVIHIIPIPGVYEVSTTSLSFITYLLHYANVTSSALWKPQTIYPHTQKLYCNAQLVKFMIITSHCTSFKYIFSFPSTQTLTKCKNCSVSHANNKFTKPSCPIRNCSNLRTQSYHQSNTNTTQLYRLPTYRISNISPRRSQKLENSVPRFTNSAPFQTIQFQFQFIHPLGTTYNWYSTRNRNNVWNFRLQTWCHADW
jgi:hypothetical protein